MHPTFHPTAAQPAAGWTWPAEDQVALVADRVWQVAGRASHGCAHRGPTSTVAAAALSVSAAPMATGGRA